MPSKNGSRAVQHRKERAIVPMLMSLCGCRATKMTELAHILALLDREARKSLFQVAVREGLAPTIDVHLRSRGWGNVLEQPEREILQVEHERNIRAFFQQVQALTSIAIAFERDAIPFRLLKGVALASQCYPYPTGRGIGDIDIWIRAPDLERATRVLRQLGLGVVWPKEQAPDFIRVYAKELVFIPGEKSSIAATVDLHWHPVGPWWVRAILGLDEEMLFVRSEAVMVAGRSYMTLDPTDNMLYLCLHAGLGHRYEGVRWMVDIAMLAKSGEINWERLNERAAGSRSTAIVWRAIKLLDYALGSDYSAHLTARPAAWQRRLLRRVLPGFPHRKGDPDEEQPDVALPLDRLALLPGLLSIGGALWRLLWPPDRWVRLRYPKLRGKSRLHTRMHHLARMRHLLRPRWRL